MTWYPEAAATEEPGGANFAPVMSSRLMESVTSRVGRESQQFHEKMAQKLGVQTEAGRVHLRAARVYREGKARFHEDSDELGELPPKSIIAAHKAAVGFHKKAAEKTGLDTDEAHAHVAELERHLDVINKAKQQLKASEVREHGTERKRSGFSDRYGVNEAEIEEFGIPGMSWGGHKKALLGHPGKKKKAKSKDPEETEKRQKKKELIRQWSGGLPARASGREAYLEPRQEDSHEEGTFVGPRYEKSHQAERGS